MDSLRQLLLFTALALTLLLLAGAVSWRNTGRRGAIRVFPGTLGVCHTGLLKSLQSPQSPESQAAAAQSLHACVRAAITGVSNDSLAASLRRITEAPHIAGTLENMAAAAFVESSLKVPPVLPSFL